MISRPRLVALALPLPRSSPSCRSDRADVLEQVLVKVNGDILTKTELEAKQIAAHPRAHQLRRRCRTR